jgi:chemotaxis protein methyltransferase CheR
MRRLDGFISRSGMPDVEQYCQLIGHDSKEREKLLDFLTINVSEFYRDAVYFEYLQKQILPELLRSNARLNIWSAGCSNGSEPYSVAVILERLSPFHSHRILATDIDKKSLNKAQAGGPYAAAELRNVPEQVLSKHFSISDNKYWINERIKKKVEFKQHDLMLSRYETNFDLIICRNVVIYFSEDAKRQINVNFFNVLNENGILFIGATETMMNTADIGFQKVASCFYKKAVAEKQVVAAR